MNDLADVGVEQALLGAILLEGDQNPGVVAHIRQALPLTECFTLPRHQVIYRAMMKLGDTGGGFDTFTIRAVLHAEGTLEEIGGVEAIATLADTIPTGANVKHHCAILKDLWLRRVLVREAKQAEGRALAREVPIADGFAETVTKLVEAAAPAIRPAATLGEGAYPALEALVSRGTAVLDAGATSTGFDSLDRLLGGLAPERMIVLAARPKMGKTSCALHMALTAAEQGLVALYSLEMGTHDLTGRILLAEAGVTHWRGREFSDAEVQKLSQAAHTLKDLPLLIDTSADTPGAVRLSVQALIAKGTPPRLVVIDYLQLMRWPGKNESKNIEVGHITRFLKKRIAMDLQVPVLLLSQLSRDSVKGEKPRPPILSDLRDSGSIEQDADQIVMLHYAGAENGRADEAPWGPATRTELYVRGNRHGAAGKLDVFYDRPTGRWRDMTTHHLAPFGATD